MKRKKSLWLTVVLAGLAILLGLSPGARSAEAPKDVKVGVFVANLFDLDFSERDVEATFWVWFNHADADFDAQKGAEVVNARAATQLQHFRSTAPDGSIWETMKYSALLNETWTLANYPFDRQKIKIAIESTAADARTIRFVPDLEQTDLMGDLSLAGWTIEGISASTSAVSYHTTFGDPTLGHALRSDYPRATFEISIRRDGWRLFFSTFIGFVLSIALAGIVLTNNAFRKLSDVIEMGGQIGIGTGAVFSVVGSGYILQGGLPPTTEFSLADAFQITAFTVAFLTMLSVFAVHALRKRGRAETALVIGKILFACYVVVCLFVIYRVVIAVMAL